MINEDEGWTIPEVPGVAKSGGPLVIEDGCCSIDYADEWFELGDGSAAG